METSNILITDMLNDPNQPSILCIYHDANSNGNQECKKATEVQDFYQAKAIDVIVIVFVGNKISVRYPNSGDDQWEEYYYNSQQQQELEEATAANKNKNNNDSGRKVTVNHILQSIDDDDEWGLETPIFLFSGKQSHGLSFRSEKRVPTHLVLSPGRGYSMEEYLQSLVVGVSSSRPSHSLKEENHHDQDGIGSNQPETLSHQPNIQF